MTIGVLANAAGTPISTVRFYEKRGLLSPPARTPSGYRVYVAEDATRVRFIRRGQELGFNLDELKTLLSMADAPTLEEGRFEDCARSQIAEIRAKIEDLQRMGQALSEALTAPDSAERRVQRLVSSLG